MANKIEITEAQQDRARELGRQAWKLRHVVRCPYPEGSKLADIWHSARDEARRAGERPEVIDERPPVETLVERLNRHFRGTK